jgi:hypothetical protein
MTATITRYQTRVEATERNAELLDAVFTELAEIDADGFTLKVFRFADDNTFVHILITHDDVNRPPISTRFAVGAPSSPGSPNASRAPSKPATR